MPHTYFEADGLANLQSAYYRVLAILGKHQSAPDEIKAVVNDEQKHLKEMTWLLNQMDKLEE